MMGGGKNLISGIIVCGLFLIGFGVMILAFPEIFALLAAIVFFIMGAGCFATAWKIYLAGRKFRKMTQDVTEAFRENVRVRDEENEL